MNIAMFPGQGAQFVGMGKDLYEESAVAKERFSTANEILGFSITDIMFDGDADALKETRVTQPAIFLHSVISYELAQKLNPNMAAGHSLGEFSALTAIGALSFEDGLAWFPNVHKTCKRRAMLLKEQWLRYSVWQTILLKKLVRILRVLW